MALTRLLPILGLLGATLAPLDLNGVGRAVPAPGARATALFFVAHDCPIANGYAPEIRRIAARYAKDGVVSYLVYVEPGLSVKAARQHEAAFGYHLPALRDTAHVLVKKYRATVTPEAVVLSPGGAMLYAGRIDDKFADLGRPRFAVSRHDLRAALDAVVTGKAVPAPTTQAVGCPIPPLP